MKKKDKTAVLSLQALDLCGQIRLRKNITTEKGDDFIKRTRQNRIEIYLSDDENRRLIELCKKTKFSKSELIRLLILYQRITIPPENFGDMLIELRRIGNNLNQLARTANTKGFVIGSEITKALAQLRDCEAELMEALKRK